MLYPNYHKHPQINIARLHALLQLLPLPVIFGSGLAPLISNWVL